MFQVRFPPIKLHHSWMMPSALLPTVPISTPIFSGVDLLSELLKYILLKLYNACLLCHDDAIETNRPMICLRNDGLS